MMSAVATQLIPALQVYCADFKSKYGTMIPEVTKEYARRIAKNGITGEQFMAGVERLKKNTQETQWTPNPEQFAAMCIPRPEDFGIPTQVQVHREIIKARTLGTKHEYSHNIVRYLDARIGFNVNQMEAAEAIAAFKDEYNSAVQIAMAGKLPEPRLAIAQAKEEDAPITDERIQELEQDPLASRILAMRKATV